MSEDELRRCETRVDGAMRDPWVKFMIDAMHDMGCPIDRSFFSCVRCGDGDNRPLCGSVARFRSKSDLDMATVAGLPEVDDDTIVNIEVCADAKMSFQRFTKFLTHELVHVYDFGRSRINMTNLLHHACTEIRANNLSRECYTMEEFRRGFFDIRKRHPVCRCL